MNLLNLAWEPNTNKTDEAQATKKRVQWGIGEQQAPLPARDSLPLMMQTKSSPSQLRSHQLRANVDP